MYNEILLALWFFAPAGAANVMPILVARIPWLQRYNQPMDAGKSWRGVRIFGANKTWRGLISGIIAAILVVWLQVWLVGQVGWIQNFAHPVPYETVNIALLGFLFGLGALGGDAIESFFKRRNNLKPGQSWFPFDQIDYIIGGALLTLPLVHLSFITYLWVFLLWAGIHLFSSYLGWRWSLKDHPI